jgi:class 3 adenylate cyclase
MPQPPAPPSVSGPPGTADPTITPSFSPSRSPEFAGGRYQLVRFLGEGGRKRVYLAHDTRLQRDVAFALIKLEGLDQLGMTRAYREAEAMARLGDHPHIVTIHDIGEENGQLYVVSQYMAGGDLAQVLRSSGGALPIDDVVRIARQLASALEHAHGEGIVHRDIKPYNVWLTPDGTAKLGDFGLAVQLGRSRLTAEGAVVGTVAYLAPELGLGREVDARADIYALGALVYELLCGTPPFTGDDAVAVISQHINTRPVAPSVRRPDVPPQLEQLVLKMLQKLPEDRPQTAGEVRQALDAISTAAVGMLSREDASALKELSEGFLVGRESELRELRAAVDSAFAGRGRIILITGEAGVGKSRLAAEAETYSNLRGAQVLVGRALEDEGAPSYWPWIQLIRNYVRSRDAETVAAAMGVGAVHIAQVVPEVRALLPNLPDAPVLEPDQARFRFFDAITSFVVEASRNKPMMVLLEDLHAADRQSLMLLQFVARAVVDARVLLVLTLRDGDDGLAGAVAEVVAELSRARGALRLRLAPLSYDEVREMLEAIAGQKLDSRDERALVAAIHEESGGSPYFVEEIVRHLVESGRLYRQGGKWVSAATRIEDLGIPAGIREVITHRLARLSDGCRHVLSIAAVFGREFRREILERIVDDDLQSGLAAHLSEALRGGIVRVDRDDPGRLIFDHAVMREILYEDLGAGERVGLHDRIGLALEEFYEDDIESHLAEVAHHLVAGAEVGDAGKAMDYSWWAGERATSLYAYDEAAKHYEQALDLLERAGDDEPQRRCELLIALGEARWRAGETAAAKKTYRRAADLARKLELANAYARAALGYGGGAGGFGVTGRSDQALIGLLRTALALLPERDSVLRARLLCRLAVELYFTDEAAEREALAEEAVAMAERLGDPRITILALYSRLWSQLGPDNLEAQLQMGEEIVRRARATEEREMEFRGRHFRLNALLQLGDIDGVEAEIVACRYIADQLRQPYYSWQATVFQTMQALLQGNYAEAEEFAQQAFTIGQRGHDEMAMVAFAIHSFFMSWRAGTIGELGESGERLSEQYPDSAWPAALGLVYSEADDRDRAARQFRRLSRDGFASIRRDTNWLTAMACLSLTCRYLANKDSASLLYELLLPYADRCISISNGAACLGSTHTFLGFLCSTLERWDDAIEHFEAAFDAIGKIGARYFEPRMELEYARALLARGSHPKAAMRHIDRGLEVARAQNMPRQIDQLLKMKLDLQDLGGLDDAMTSIHAIAQSVEIIRPDLRPAAAPDGTVTIMFSDIENSTVLTDRLGDRAWMRLLRTHNGIISDSVRRHGGFDVKNQGDGFMLVFPSARKAIGCAIDIQRALAKHRMQYSRDPLHVRIGLHTGEVIREGEDFFGKHVILAARIAAQASGDEILVSSLVKELVASGREFEFDEPRRLELKGLPGEHLVHPVRWNGDGRSEAGRRA